MNILSSAWQRAPQEFIAMPGSFGVVEPYCRMWLYGIKAARKRAASAGTPAAPLTAAGRLDGLHDASTHEHVLHERRTGVPSAVIVLHRAAGIKGAWRRRCAIELRPTLDTDDPELRDGLYEGRGGVGSVVRAAMSAL